MTYTKTFSEAVPANARWYRVNLPGTTTTILGGDPTLRVNLSGTRTGTKVADWREKIRLGQNAASPYTLDRQKLTEQVPGHAEFKAYNGSTFSRWEIFDGFALAEETNQMIHLAASTTKANAMALAKTYKKVESELSHMNSPAVIAEFIDVLRMFGRPFASIVDLTNRRLNRLELERRRLKGSTQFKQIKWHEIVASTYLEYAFGLDPLIKDTASVAEAFARLHLEVDGDFRFRKKVVGRGLDEVSSVSKTDLLQPSTVGLMFHNWTTKKTQAKVQYVCGLKSTPRADFGTNERLLELLGFRASNWVPALWEAVPWSFLVDYFTNVQQILNAGVTNTSAVSWIVRTDTICTERIYEAKLDTVGSANRAAGVFGFSSSTFTGSGGVSKRVRNTVSRTIPSSLGVPPLVVDFDLSNKQLTNIAALLIARRPTSSALWLF